MPSKIDGEEKTIDIDDKGPGAEVIFQKKKKKKKRRAMNQLFKLSKTIIRPMTHLRNLMSQWMFEMNRSRNLRKAAKLRKKLWSQGVISNQITLKQLKSIAKELRKGSPSLLRKCVKQKGKEKKPFSTLEE